MSNVKGFPGNQPFCIKGRKNLTKTKAWWQTGSSNNGKRAKQVSN